MVLPIPAIASSGSLSVNFVKNMTIAFAIFLFLETGLSGIRFYVLDIWGGVIMTLISVFGFFVIRYNFDLQWTIMFGITIFFYGLIHFVMLLERGILNWGNFPDTTSGPKELIRDILFIAAPVIDWTLSGLCMYTFKSATTNVYNNSERQPLIPHPVNNTFTPFSGQGRKLA